MLIGTILVPGRRTVTAALRIMGLSQYRQFRTYHRVLNRAARLPLGVIAWLVRNAEASKTRDVLVLGYTLVFALMAVVSLSGYALPGHQAFWVTCLTQALVAVGFFVAGRASMSAQTS